MLADCRLLFSLCLAFATSLATNVTADDETRAKRLLGGKLVPKGKNEFVVRITKYCGKEEGEFSDKPEFSTCSGSVISKKHVLTAAHCVMCVERDVTAVKFNLRMSPEVFVLTPQGAQYGPMANVRIHRSAYFLVEHVCDLAIIELDKGDEFEGKPLKVAGEFNSNIIKSLTAYGFGEHAEVVDGKKEIKMDHELRVAEIPVFGENWYTLNGGHAGLLMLAGDTGGPLVKEFKDGVYLFAVASAYPMGDDDILNGDIKDEGIADLFMKIPTYCDFIEQFTNGMARCEEVPW